MRNRLEQAVLLRTEKYAQMKQFWQQQLEYIPFQLRTDDGLREPALQRVPMNPALAARLHKVSKGEPLSLFALLAAGLQWAWLDYGQQEMLSFGTPPILEDMLEDALGDAVLFASEQAGDISFRVHAAKTRETLANGYRHQDFPIRELLHSGSAAGAGTHCLLDLLCRLEGLHAPFPDGISARLEISLLKQGDSWWIETGHRMSKREAALPSVFLAYAQHALLSWLEEPDVTASAGITLPTEMQQTLLAHAAGDRIAVPDGSLVRLFRRQAALSADQLAVWSGQGAASYRELDELSERLAFELRRQGCKPGDVVGVSAERSVLAVAAMIGILKAGCAYMPLDPEWPEDRLRDILTDSSCRTVVHAERPVSVPGARMVDMKQLPLLDGGTALDEPGADDLAYVLYTSGTTGKPKGVMIEHRQVLNLLAGLKAKLLFFAEQARIACLAPFVFDASVAPIFAALTGGHTLYIVPDEVRLDGAALFDFYRQQRIEISDGTPMHLQMLALAASQRDQQTLPVRLFMIGGEALPASSVRSVRSLCSPAARIVNVYGPTECCVDATFQEAGDELDELTPIVPIGRPLPNQRVYVLDRRLQLRPYGAVGEICIAGGNVGRGYRSERELAACRFAEDPFYAGERLYRTGDLGRMLPDGSIDCLGRADDQVKWKGYRIELGEIEQTLQAHPNITNAAAMLARAEPDDAGQLIAYYTAAKPLAEGEARAWLEKRLPGYMVPAAIISMEQLPLKANGKLDRSRLPLPEETEKRSEEAQAPLTELEQSIAEVWRMVLGRPAGDVQASFFQSGGDSLKALRMMMELEARGIPVKLHDIFKHSSIRELAAAIAQDAKEEPSASSRPREDAQEWFRSRGIAVEPFTLLDDGHAKVAWRVPQEAHAEAADLLDEARQLFPPAALPHYLLSDPSAIDALLAPPKPDIHKKAERLAAQAVRDNEIFSEHVTRQRRVGTYPLAPIQQAFLEVGQAASGTVMTLVAGAPVQVVQQAVIGVIREHALLRSVLLADSRTAGVWAEFEAGGDIAVPALDISSHSLPEQRVLLEQLVRILFYVPYADPGRLFYRLLLVRLNEREYKLLLPCHHAIFDGMSGQVLEQSLAKRLSGAPADSSQTEQHHYSGYVRQLQKGPVLKEDALIRQFELNVCSEAAVQLQQWLQVRSDGLRRRYVAEVKFQPGEALSPEQWFAFPYRILARFAASHGLPSELPLLLLYYGRRYEDNTYFDMVGPCIDLLPCLLSSEASESGVPVARLTRMTQQYNVNFAALLINERLRRSFAEAADLLRPLANSGILFNFHGYADQAKLELFRMLGEHKQGLDGGEASGLVRTPISFDFLYTADCFRATLHAPFAVDEAAWQRDAEELFAALRSEAGAG
ncbi:amino acid adenylation domain-containing protein [Xylanibacillus composti]|uniref:Carrier domain-containing protein n=1 Tax=Xylanibacillus composti TaxID=1572762 RepID=A0A8J4M288_9BACL|nr:non-ribosomal peptide synthetase [Xylanibacillus composti]MDT9724046.1 amino acid adenylation domain-containing protein [Xylanibacillus composti]GIQ69439.1 hypothetical protein XYCOK13_22630 [Xylanibacillus composti]